MDPTPITLPNGSRLEYGGRVRVPKDLIWLPEVKALAERGVILEEGSQSPDSEVLAWPMHPADVGRDMENYYDFLDDDR